MMWERAMGTIFSLFVMMIGASLIMQAEQKKDPEEDETGRREDGLPWLGIGVLSVGAGLFFWCAKI